MNFKRLLLILFLTGLAESSLLAEELWAVAQLKWFPAATVSLSPAAGEEMTQAKIKAMPSNVISRSKARSDAIQSQSIDKNGRVKSEPLINNVPLSSFVKPPVASLPSSPAAVEQAAERLPVKQPILPTEPDLRPVWRLFNQQKYDQVEQDMIRLKSQYPRWKAPAELLDLLAQKLREQQIERAMQEMDAETLQSLGERYPDAFSCLSIDRAWALAAARAKMNNMEPLKMQLQSLVTDCEKEEDRLATVYKAKQWLTREEWKSLISLGAAMQRTADGEERFQQLVYQNEIEDLELAIKLRNDASVESLFFKLKPQILARKDVSKVLLVAWHALDVAKLADAQALFAIVLEIAPENDHARYGLALSHLRQQNYDALISVAQQLPESHAGRNDLLLTAYLEKANQANLHKDLHQTLAFLEEAKKIGTLPRYAMLMQAWARLGLGDAEDAAEKFAALYSAFPEEESGNGVMASYLTLDRTDAIKVLASTEPLASKYKRHVAAQLFGQKRFFEARALDPSSYGDAGGIAATQATLGFGLRDKSGERGLSQLSVRQMPLLDVSVPTGTHGELNLSLREVSLDSGAVSRNAMLGSGSSGAWQYTPVTKVTGLEPRVNWHDDTWDIALGMTPNQGEISSHPVGYVSYQNIGKFTTVRSSLYMEPVRESILSYTGLRDPYSGKQWGQVVRKGLRLSSQNQLSNHWSVSGSVNMEYLEGEHVETNRHAGAFVGVAKNLDLSAFSYAVVGLYLNYDRYEKNLSHFTLGHGGYFSPQRFVSMGPAFDFLTRENQQFILKGRLSMGAVSIAESASPVYPGQDDGSSYAGNKNNGLSYTAEVSGVWRINDRVQIGGAISERNAPQFKEQAGMLFLRVLFESRQTVLSSDLPTKSFNGLY